ncbi:leucine-rich repeat transmembrane neuronal protein 3 [Vanessa atalanta]|uniref:leucine-rich repeat transmembrane neuronal protein 3 n=1 Tax=Vanessa atalanta TaxID=42275 RepID=UPI001FCE1190|nr:leucine-rich repeat transmembrane neuronal protein 3 [Vanessa atalanta]
MLVLVCLAILTTINTCVGTLCPKQCDCDMDVGLNRATCVDQNIVSVDVGVPKEVQVYSLSRNVISELENFCFKAAGYTNLKILDLSYNLIFWIGLHAFSGLDKLTNLDLSNNRLRFIPSDLFWDTPQLEILDFSSNVFEQLNNEPFIIHTKLQVLNLNNCRIKFLPVRMFNRLPNLKQIDLSENYMVSLNLNVIRPLRKLERIKLRNEYWQCNPDFIAIETWITSHDIKYEKQCTRKVPKMSEKMISLIVEKESVDVNTVWNVTVDKNNSIAEVVTNKTKQMTTFEKFDRDFSAVQAFVIGLEVGLAIGIVFTYIWLVRFCSCKSVFCRRPQTRRQRRMQRVDGDMRTNLLWNNVTNPDLETPPLYRRQLSLPDRSPPFPAVNIAGLQVDAIRIDRSETPPPPYNECRLNI